ncbi:sugar phosphate isomerase/epimerase family protein [Salinibacterium hongtaonis]|uniref:Xylose isomerase n=1 Tax=Homoserinimonas hongtaonis TaxID=2079791 RepID=A0A2U1T191_9MICO|nr:TIM barrel protein [Salinibacterium hongtaonis]PWB97637.1 xylose isomerase [Salinibacterium hongtaonis]
MNRFAVDHLTALDLSPTELIMAAAHAGFSDVGIRIRPMDETELPWPMAPDSAMMRHALDLLDSTGLGVTQIEVLFLDERVEIASVERDLEIGARLGAEFLYCVGMDDDHARMGDRFGQLETLCRSYGIRPLLEPMAYRPVSTVEAALAIVEQTPTGGVLIDSLHFARSGGVPAAVRNADAFRLPLVQLCDAGAPPSEVPADAVAPRGQRTDISPLQWEARTGRLLPGDGSLDLTELMSALPRDVIVALEAPNPRAIAESGIDVFLADALTKLFRVARSRTTEPGVKA